MVLQELSQIMKSYLMFCADYAGTTPECRVLYKKLKFDYYWYLCELKPDAERSKPLNKAK
jgi:hypothetical protein